MAKLLITGTSKGIAFEAALILARAGHEVVATMRNPGASDLEKVARETKPPMGVLAMDVDDEPSVDAVFGRVGDAIDVLANNAGIFSIEAVEDESLPYDENTIYPHGRRIHASLNNPNKPEASPSLVGEMIRYVIESDDSRLRFPVGPDALSFLGWRASLGDAEWVGLGGLEGDDDYFQRVFADTGVDLRPPRV